MKNKIFQGLLFIILSTLSVKAQVASPVTVNTLLTPPYSSFLDDYISTWSDKLVATLVFNDMNETSWNVRLRITIESSQISISTKENFRPAVPVTLIPGSPLRLSGSDLAPFLNYNNINVSGISMADLQKNGKLPEGYYTFCVEVYDYNSNRLLSGKSCAGAMLQLNDVPMIQAPSNGQVIGLSGPVNIPFQWQLTTPASNPGSVEYQLSLYKILDPDVNPENAIDNRVVEKIWQSSYVPQTSLVYGTAQTALEPGQKYVYRVQARDAVGKDNFKNNGYSQARWFYYGYPGGGNIAVISPFSGKSFTKNEFRRFQWQGPDNAKTGQQVSYHLKIVKINEGQDSSSAILSNPAWYETTTGQLPARYGGDVMLDQKLETLQNYAWQVTAFTGSQAVAKSMVYTFTGPPLIEWFWAGNHKVQVTKTFNKNLNSLSGKGTTAISESGKQVEFRFDSLQIENAGGEYVLRRGNLYADLSGFTPVELTPELPDNGNASFFASAIRLNKSELAIKGSVKWNFPLATASPALEQVVTESQWINFDTYKLLGSISLGSKNKFDLIDPAGYRLLFDSLSNFLISDNKYQLRLFGNIMLPDRIRNSEKQRMSLPFRNADNLFYFSQQNVRIPENIELISNSGIQLKPLEYVVDFSENRTPDKVSNDPAWKGIFIPHFVVDLKKNIAKDGQLSLNYELHPEITLSVSGLDQCSFFFFFFFFWREKEKKTKLGPSKYKKKNRPRIG